MRRGCHLITREILQEMPEIAQLQVGLLHVFVQHTSASLTLNENADPDVRVDLESSLDALAPKDISYEHTIEGPDDMPAHVKTTLTDSGLTIPIRDGRPALGTWQGIYFCEHRNHGGSRRLVLTLFGQPRAE
jgi:secondary thiamine-phosphate synthase enzyme